jgi:hypothetical protein
MATDRDDLVADLAGPNRNLGVLRDLPGPDEVRQAENFVRAEALLNEERRLLIGCEPVGEEDPARALELYADPGG